MRQAGRSGIARTYMRRSSRDPELSAATVSATLLLWTSSGSAAEGEATAAEFDRRNLLSRAAQDFSPLDYLERYLRPWGCEFG